MDFILLVLVLLVRHLLMVWTTLVFILIGKLVIHTFAHLAKLLEDLVVSFINCLHLIKVILILLVRFGELLNDLWSPLSIL
jgi:hypothetical protein